MNSFYIDDRTGGQADMAVLEAVLKQFEEGAGFIYRGVPQNNFDGIVICPLIGEKAVAIQNGRTLMPRITFNQDNPILWESLFWSQTRVAGELKGLLENPKLFQEGNLNADLIKETHLSPELRNYLLSRVSQEGRDPKAEISDAELITSFLDGTQKLIRFLFSLKPFNLGARLAAAQALIRSVSRSA